MSTISSSAGTFTPALVRGYRAEQESRTIVHQLLGGGVHVSLRPATPRTGTLEALFLDEATADACRAAHAAGLPLTLTDPDAPSAEMSYVAVGRLALAEDDAVGWWLTVSYQEIP